MPTPTFKKDGVKATTAAKLDAAIFEVAVENHALLKQAYVAYLANGRENLAVVKKRGEVSGGGRKPWKQKGTGRARFGSSRNPIWRGGGIVFGPNGNENYSHSLNAKSKQLATRQALSLANASGKVSVIETFECKDGKVSQTIALLDKINATGRTVIVVSNKDALVDRATRNIQNVKAVQADYLNVYDILNADNIIISNESLNLLSTRLGGAK